MREGDLRVREVFTFPLCETEWRVQLLTTAPTTAPQPVVDGEEQGELGLTVPGAGVVGVTPL